MPKEGLLLHSLGSTVVDGQGMPCQAMLLFQLGVEHVEPGKGLAERMESRRKIHVFFTEFIDLFWDFQWDFTNTWKNDGTNMLYHQNTEIMTGTLWISHQQKFLGRVTSKVEVSVISATNGCKKKNGNWIQPQEMGAVGSTNVDKYGISSTMKVT